MKRIFLGLFLLTMHIYGMDVTHSEDESLNPEVSTGNPKVSIGRKFLSAVKSIAHDVGFDRSLQAIEKGLSSVSDSYRYNNMLASVNFNASVLVPELRENSAVIVARLSTKDLKCIHDNFSCIQDRITAIADNQSLEHVTPLLVRVMDQTDSTFSALGAKFVEGAATLAAAFSRDLAHSLKEELFLETLEHFERIGNLTTYIKTSKLRKSDEYRMEEINNCLETLKPIFQKAKVL